MDKNNNLYKKYLYLSSAFIAAIAVLLCMLVLKNITPTNYIRSISSANEMYMDIEGTDIKGQKITLPYTLKDVEAGTKISLYNDFIISQSNMMYAKTVYAPLTVTVDGTEVYSYGKKGTFPSILRDPPTQVCLINIPTADNARHIEFIYEFPYDRNGLSLSAPLYGEGSNLMRYLSLKMIYQFLCAILEIFIGIFLVVMFLALAPSEVNARSVLWLGLFGVTFGLWSFCECNYTVLLMQQPYLLYVGAFVGMFSCTLPILLFAQEIIDKKSIILIILTAISGISACTAVLLQLVGKVPFHKSMFFFHILMPINFVAVAAAVFIKGFKEKRLAKFSAALFILAASAILELVNYSLNIVSSKTLILQTGVIIFLILTEYFSGIDLRKFFALKSENRRLADNMAIMEKQMTAQYESGKIMIDTAEELKKQRHDLKHQYVVLDGLIERKEYDRAKAYIAELIKEIPQDKVVFYCRNEALNAIFTYYVNAAKEHSIKTDISLDINEKTENITDVQLCILFGNLLENAIEACCRVQGERFVKLYAYIKAEMMYIAMDNSYDGNIRKKGSHFISSKRGEIGTGLRSVAAIAEKHGGTAKFTENENVFESSVCLKI